jgi:hypothetical protein
MVQRFYCVGGIRYRVCCDAQWMYDDDYQLTAFRTEPGEWDQNITFSVEEALPAPVGEPVYSDSSQTIYCREDTVEVYEGGKYPYLWIGSRGNETRAVVRSSGIPGRITVKLVLSALRLPKELIRRGGFLLHSSYILYNGKAILFTAPSGTGKSTQADLWVALRGAELLNGDRSSVMVTSEGVSVHGVPFCGSSGVSKNVSAPLAAIIYLSQAPATTITRLTGLRAFRSLWEGVSVDLWDRAEATACTDLVLEAIRQVPVFHLACTPDETAVRAVERAIFELR